MSNQQIIKAVLEAFKAKAYFLVSDLSGSEPHPQLEHEMMTDFVRFIKDQLTDEDNLERPLDEELEDFAEELEQLFKDKSPEPEKRKE